MAKTIERSDRKASASSTTANSEDDGRKRSASPANDDPAVGDTEGGAAPASDPPLPEEDAPPLPTEAPPQDDDGWDYEWDEAAQATLFKNHITGEKTWKNPRASAGVENSYNGEYDRHANLSTSLPASGYPASTGYATSGYPASTGYATSGYPASTGYATSGYPASTGYATSGYPASTGYATAGYPASTGYATSGYPYSGYPYSGYPASGNLTSPYPTSDQSTDAPGTSSPPQKRLWGGYNPRIHGAYDPNADYALEAQKDMEEAEAAAAAATASAAYANTGQNYSTQAHFNRFTGKFQHADMGPDMHNDENKSKRQLNAYFDVDAAANSHDGRSLKAERRNKTYTKKEIKAFNDKRREKKEEKRRAWLRD